MALLGMQADMQCKSYFSGHYSTMDRNLDTSGSIWPFGNADTIINSEQNCNGASSQSSRNQHWVYNKEALKQTMLKHQAIFTNQIHELHRLYWRQREVMDEIKRNKLQSHHLNLETLQSNPHLSQKSCEFAQKQYHFLSLPQVNPASNQLFVPTAEGKSTHAGLDPAENKLSSKDCQKESKWKKYGKKILNLELPAHEYIDSEEEEPVEEVYEVSGYHPEKISEVVHLRNQQSCHENAGFNPVLQKDYLTPGAISFKTDMNEPHKLEKEADLMPKFLADLNEPINLDEEATPMPKFLADLNEPPQEDVASRSRDFPSPTGHRKFPYQDPSQKSNSGLQVLPMDAMQNSKFRRDLKTCSNGLQLEKNKMQEWTSYDDEAGQSRSKAASISSVFNEEEVSKSFEDVDLQQAHELCFVMDQSKKISGSEGLRPEGASSRHVSLTDVGNSEASLVSKAKKHKHDFVQNPVIVVQALPCFNRSAPFRKSFRSRITRPGHTGKKSHYRRNLKSRPKVDGTKFHQPSSGSNSDPKTSESPSPSNNCNGMDCSNSDDLTSEQRGLVNIIKPSVDVKPAKDMNSNFMSHNCSSDGEKKIEGSTEGLPLLNTNSVCKEKRGGEQLTSDKLVVGNGLDKNILGFGVVIDLNSSIDEHESWPTPSLLSKPHLEAPISPENKESSPPRGESGESEENQVGMPCQMLVQEDGDVREEFGGTALETAVSGHVDREAQEDLLGNLVEGVVSGQEGGNGQDELVRNAVDAIISISSSKVQTCSESTTCGPSEPCWSDNLYWFARVVSRVEDDPNSEFGVVMSSYMDSDDNEDCLSNGLDYFEAMTLRLTESKLEERWCISYDTKEEAVGATSLSSQPGRRGQMRRAARQQRKDFQTEILPSLATLSRYEVTADLQTIEGLIEAANNSLRTDSSRKKDGKARAKGGKRSYKSKSKVTVSKICSQSEPQTTSYKEKGNVGRKLVGWGNITRRRRGRRCPATNPRTIPGQVHIE